MTTEHDLSTGLARPAVSTSDAAAIASQGWGLRGTVTELGSQQDRNFLLRDDGRVVLKVANPAASRAELEAQSAALRTLAAAGLRVPAPVQSLHGNEIEEVTVGGVALLARVLTFVDGASLMAAGPFGVPQARVLGDTAGRVVAALADFRHEGTHRSTQWDLRAAGEVVEALRRFVPRGRDEITDAVAPALHRLASLDLPTQVVHGDLTDDNVVVDEAGLAGVIDFGDLQHSWRVGELATTCAGVLANPGAGPGLALEAVRAFAAYVPLTEPELRALWPLVVLRGAVLVVSNAQQQAVDGGNDYAADRIRREWQAFRLAAAADPGEMAVLVAAMAVGGPAALPATSRPRDAHGEAASAALRPRDVPEEAGSAALRLRDVPGQAGSAALRSRDAPGSAPGRVDAVPLLPAGVVPAVVDLSVSSAELDGGAWLDPAAEHDVLARAGGAAVTRWGEYRLTRARPYAARNSVPTLALGVDLVVPEGTPLTAPFDGEVTPTDAGVELRGDMLVLTIGGDVAAAGGRVRRGDPLGAGRTLRLQLHHAGRPRPPFLVTPPLATLWRAVSPDPSPLIGVDVAAREIDPDGWLRRRDRSFARVQEHYFQTPPQIERGWREFLVDTSAQVYVDAVNNVATTGHAHPRVVEAAARQWALLNTNSRFHYAAVAELSERLAALAPEGLDSVFLVNSGSEAVDLAIRLAQIATGRPRVLAAREAYHGWTMASDAVSTSIGDNPRALTTRPDWVELIAAPNAVRGWHRGPGAAAGYLADLDAQLDTLGEEGRARIAGVVLEPAFGNGGGVLLPDGYLAGVFDRVRALGGVCISDEVQVGYGRLGKFFWGCEQQGAVPDVITVAKGMGNGQPLGAVITTRAIAGAFAAEGSFFSSSGGSPVSARIGLAVLDVMRDEALQDNARVLGTRLARRLRELAQRHPAIGAVHGMGLFLGVELVTDRERFTPATTLAGAVCDAALERGVIVQPTGDHKNVLKIKPPLCLGPRSVDRIVDALDQALFWT